MYGKLLLLNWYLVANSLKAFSEAKKNIGGFFLFVEKSFSEIGKNPLVGKSFISCCGLCDFSFVSWFWKCSTAILLRLFNSPRERKRDSFAKSGESSRLANWKSVPPRRENFSWITSFVRALLEAGCKRDWEERLIENGVSFGECRFLAILKEV